MKDDYDLFVCQNIGQVLLHLRKRNDLTRKVIGDFLGVSGSQIAKWERGEDRISISRLMRLSGFFKVNFGYFLINIE